MKTLRHLASVYRGQADVLCIPVASRLICGEVAALFNEKAIELEAIADYMVSDPRCDVRYVRKLRAVIGERTIPNGDSTRARYSPDPNEPEPEVEA